MKESYITKAYRISQLLNIVLFVFCSILISCRLDDDYNLECIGNVKVSLPSHQFKTGLINQYYSDEIKASVDNEPNDDHYDYSFTIEGRIPDGVDVVFDDKTVVFEGFPIQSGRFKFKIFLDIDPYYPESLICVEYSTSREYEMIIDSN